MTVDPHTWVFGQGSTAQPRARHASVTAMQPARFLYLPYRLARLPLAAVDRRLRRHLGSDSSLRAVSRATLTRVDRAAAAVFDETPLRTE